MPGNSDQNREIWATPKPSIAHDIIKEVDVRVPMRDGLELAANVYRPEAPGEYPVIMSHTPYGKDIHWGLAQSVFGEAWSGTGIGYEPWSPPIAGTCTFEAENHNFWVPQGYVIITVDARGSWRSPGEDGGSGRDIYDAVEWAAKQEWSNGNIGMSGVSALSENQYYAAVRNPPHLKAICPWSGTPGEFVDFGGIGPQTMPLPKILSSFLPPDNPAWPAPDETNPGEHEPRQPDAWFEEITQPVLIARPWSNHGFPGRYDIRAFRKVSSEYKWLYTHGRELWASYYEGEAQAFRKKFFDHFLKGNDSRILTVPPVRVEERNTLHSWSVQSEADFPIPRTKYERLYLDANSGCLEEDRPPGDQSEVSYESTEQDSVAFDFTFEEETSVIGFQKLRLWVTPEDATDADLFIAVRKLDRNGNEVRFYGYGAPMNYPVATGFLRLSHRTLNEQKSTDWRPYLDVTIDPKKMEPGERVACEIPILPSGTNFKQGETLRLEISGQWLPEQDLEVAYPAWKRDQTPYHWEKINAGQHTIHTGRDTPSYLLIPTVPPKTDPLVDPEDLPIG